MKKIWIITLYPEFFEPLLTCGIAAQALTGKRGSDFQLTLVNLREFGRGNYKAVDDYPYGGGPGMVIRPDVLKSAFDEGIMQAGDYQNRKEELHVIYTDPRGETFSQAKAGKIAQDYLSSEAEKDLVFICGRYEGIDERFIEQYVDECLSLGDFIMTGGEIAVMAFIDASIRLVPEVLGNKLSATLESFQSELLEHPQYTRPSEFEGSKVPEVLLSGHHKNILEWQEQMRLKKTRESRPDLLK